MLKILGGGVRDPQHLAQFAKFLVDHQDVARAQPWIADLKRDAPPSMGQVVLELEARVFKARNQDRELLALLQSRLRETPNQAGAVAALLDRFGFVKEAEEAYKAHATRNSGDPERALGLASFLARHDRPAESIAILDQAWQTCRPELVANASFPLFGAPSADEKVKRRAEAWVSEAIRKSPSAAPVLQPRLASIYVSQQRYEEAEVLYRQCLQADPENPLALNNLAWMLALRDQGTGQEALDLANRAIEKDGPSSSLIDTRAISLIRAGSPARAAQELREARASDPRNLSLALHLAWAFHAVGKLEDARAALKEAEALGLKPETRDPPERGIIARLRQELAAAPTSASNNRSGPAHE
jgi:Flp pilus assembly protein TadD